MREIKFRGRDEQGRWHFGMLRQWRDQSFAIETTQGLAVDFVDPATVGQFTGLKDFDGKEIYEGDVLLFVTARIRTPFVVTFFGAAFRGHFLEKNGDYYTLEYLLQNEVRVIGNIHDNPELLTKD